MNRRNRKRIPINYALKVSEDPKTEVEARLERQKIRLDIEVVESLKARYKDVTSLRDSFSHIIKILKDYEYNGNLPSRNSDRNLTKYPVRKKPENGGRME